MRADGIIDADQALLHGNPGQRAGEALADGPGNMLGVGAKSVGVAFVQNDAVVDHQHAIRANPLPVRGLPHPGEQVAVQVHHLRRVRGFDGVRGGGPVQGGNGLGWAVLGQRGGLVRQEQEKRGVKVFQLSHRRERFRTAAG